MLYNVYPRTFDLTDVIGVMNICDRHMGAIAMRVSCFCNLFVHCSVRVCIRLGSLAIAAASAYDPSTCEGPPTEYNRPCRLRPITSSRKFAGGAASSTWSAHPRDKWFRSDRADRTGGTRRPERVDQQTSVKPDSTLGSCFGIVL